MNCLRDHFPGKLIYDSPEGSLFIHIFLVLLCILRISFPILLRLLCISREILLAFYNLLCIFSVAVVHKNISLKASLSAKSLEFLRKTCTLLCKIFKTTLCKILKILVCNIFRYSGWNRSEVGRETAWHQEGFRILLCAPPCIALCVIGDLNVSVNSKPDHPPPPERPPGIRTS